MLGDMQAKQHFFGLVPNNGIGTPLSWMDCEMPLEEDTPPLSVSMLATESPNSPDKAISDANQQFPSTAQHAVPVYPSEAPTIDEIWPIQMNAATVSAQMGDMTIKHHDVKTMASGSKPLVFVKATLETFERNRKEASSCTMFDDGEKR